MTRKNAGPAVTKHAADPYLSGDIELEREIPIVTTRRTVLETGAMALLAGVCFGRFDTAGAAAFEVAHGDAEWRRILDGDRYDVLRQAGTERPFTSALLHETRHGTFTCAGCGRDLFASDTKFDSGTGWPSFWKALPSAAVTSNDESFGMVRNALECSRCGGHLGHVFDDGPKPTGLRYCMNGVAMRFRPAAA